MFPAFEVYQSPILRAKVHEKFGFLNAQEIKIKITMS
jgi:hypothetical protein